MKMTNTDKNQFQSVDNLKDYYRLTQSPRQQQVQYKRYLNDINHNLQSLITAGKIKRMEYIAINNRALFNRAKVQRSEWINQRYSKNIDTSFNPDMPSLRLDNRKYKRSDQKKLKKKYLTQSLENKTLKDEQFIDFLIDQEIDKIKRESLLKVQVNRKQIVEQACLEIERKLMRLPKSHIKTENINAERSPQGNNIIVNRKDHKRSVTYNLYKTQIQNLQKKEEAQKKQRMANQKYFIRKLRKINAHNIH